ncbi:Agenet domain protein [Lacunisphaera limnophila]|uniref:Agenet domain protein n=1 Tax=Lacunisphaera limnophila TaxID=1838286 RepID=A0A1D8AV32_9BACT|nr:agenet domain-containing protein [Lacunisphaera limnophila]AOS44725.1 Agenet domain protein [Lacunisphaera limnophila]
MQFLRGLGAFLGLVVMLAAADFKVGDPIEALSYGIWSKGKVIEVGDGKWKVTYDGYSASWDEWVGPDKIRAVGEVVAAAVPKPVGPAVPGQWRAGDRVEGLSYGAWYPATVLEVGGGKWKVHYDGYGSSSDEWLPAEKLRPIRTASWKVGDRVEALSYGKWYGAKIIEAESARWKVTYDGYGSSSDEWLNIDRLRAPGAKTVGGSDQAGQAVESYKLPVRPAGAQAGLEGAYLRVETYYFGSSLSLNNQGWFFTKDGRFSKSPAGGFDLAAFAQTADLRQTDGTYWIADGKITFAWADGSAPTVTDFKREKDDLFWGGLGSTRVEGFTKGWRFDGEYEGGASIGGGALMSSTTLTFARDGTFRRGSVSSFKAVSDHSVVSGGATDEADGSYEFNGHTLTLVTKGGETQAFTVFAFGDRDEAGRPDYIYRDGTMMRRQ